MKEIYTAKAIIQYMNLKGHSVFMNEITGMPCKQSPTGRRRLRGSRGSSDIIGTLKGGRACYIEVKQESERKRISFIWDYMQRTKAYPVEHYKYDEHIAEQVMFLLWQKGNGAFCMFAFDLNDVEKELERGTLNEKP